MAEYSGMKLGAQSIVMWEWRLVHILGQETIVPVNHAYQVFAIHTLRGIFRGGVSPSSSSGNHIFPGVILK